MKKALLCLALALSLLLGLGLTRRSVDDILTDIVVYHGCYGDAADKKVAALLDELESRDKARGALWREIMDYWDWVNTDLTVNENALPDDLPDDDGLCIVVLGFELNDDGSMKDELLERLRVALACAKQYPNAQVLCTGGGTAADAPDVTEGRAMGDWLLDHGLSRTRLIVEDKSMTTAENAMNSYKILFSDYPAVDSVAIVSSGYHIPWGSLLFEAGLLQSAAERGTRPIHVISNAACPVENDVYLREELLRWQTGGMLQMIGQDDLAMEFYYRYDEFEKPELKG